MDTKEQAQLWQKVQARFAEANFLQSPEWGKVNELIGYKVRVEHFADEAWCQMIVKNAKRGRYLEIAGGPLLDWQERELVQRMFARIRKIAREEKCVFVRIRPQLDASEQDLLAGLKLRKAPMHLHAEHTVILDLTKDEKTLLAEMRRQTRYEVRRALKLGIVVKHSNSKKTFAEFHQVQAVTAERQHFVPPNLKMLNAEREAFGENAQIYTAETNKGQAIAYGLILRAGDEAAYFEAASTELNHSLPGAYALQWQVMKDLKAQGVKKYNLWGIAPAGQKHHRYAGVTTFKTGFGGQVVELMPAQDLVIKPVRYALDWVFETLRKKKRHL